MAARDSKAAESTPGYFRARVAGVEQISPSLIRVHFDGPGLAGFPSTGVPDESIRLYFPRDGEVEPPPMTVRDGVLGHHDDDDARECRTYTVRHWQQERLSIDFVTHGDGVASLWAAAARVGDMLGIWGVRSWYAPPADTAWQLLVADLPGLPALMRALERLEEGERAHAIVEVAHADDRVDVVTKGDVTIDWRVAGNGRASSELADAVRAYALPDGPGYAWFAGEAAAGREIRKHLRNTCAMPVGRMSIIGYWRADKEQWLERYAPLEDRLLVEYDELVSSGVDETAAEIHWDEMLERAGL
ncbi:siderophore-interacting protein [Agreia bicolorata]|uniref:FAD-binding FR-type domain-containing protein n=1 Tax=Agreia bicolorata TaxID=110935 RepID=A0ABR5CBS9_9MICO|nr:siderophore-interacting protein [Agreia bicolorata]KJC63039.1 hypothetical protein TZ00_16770 [Agreia bicolorata]